MANDSRLSNSTSPSLLNRIRNKEPDAWSRFALVYTPLVYQWARRGGLQQSDAEDVVQDVFSSVFAKIDDFQKQGQQSRFRGWLWAITSNRVRLFYRNAGQHIEGEGGSAAVGRLQQIPSWIENEADPTSHTEYSSLVARALSAIKDDFSEKSWQAFWRIVVEEEPAAEISESLGISISAVRQAKYRVLVRIRDEIEGL